MKPICVNFILNVICVIFTKKADGERFIGKIGCIKLVFYI